MIELPAGVHTCLGTPPQEVDLDLAEPLGARRVVNYLDGTPIEVVVRE